MQLELCSVLEPVAVLGPVAAVTRTRTALDRVPHMRRMCRISAALTGPSRSLHTPVAARLFSAAASSQKFALITGYVICSPFVRTRAP